MNTLFLLVGLLGADAAAAQNPSIHAIADQVEGLDAASHQEAMVALDALVTDDPYVRAAVQVAVALDRMASRVDPTTFDASGRAAWKTARAQLAAHVAVLDVLGQDPRALDVGVEQTQSLIDALPYLASQVDVSTSVSSEAHSERLEALTGATRPCPRGPWATLPGHPFTLGMQLGDAEAGIRAARATLTDDAAAAQVDAMLALLEAYQSRSVD